MRPQYCLNCVLLESPVLELLWNQNSGSFTLVARWYERSMRSFPTATFSGVLRRWFARKGQVSVLMTGLLMSDI
jgi:hypothetical protein